MYFSTTEWALLDDYAETEGRSVGTVIADMVRMQFASTRIALHMQRLVNRCWDELERVEPESAKFALLMEPTGESPKGKLARLAKALNALGEQIGRIDPAR